MTNLDYLYNADAVKNFFSKNHFSDKKLGIKIIEHGTIVPYIPMNENGQRVWEFGGIVDGRGKFLNSSVGRFGSLDTYTPTEEIPFVSATVIYLGLFYPVWGHFITEGLRYYWFLLSKVYKNYFRNCHLVYIPWDNARLNQHENFWQLLEILDVEVDSLQPITQPTQFENIILPDESFFLANGGRFFTNEYCETIDRVRNFALKNRTPSAKKIYFFHGQRQIGEENLAEYFRSKGYEIISPEKLTFDEQLNLLINAESFAATIGSASHNSIFLRDGTEVILISRSANRFTGYQQTLDQLHPLNLNYVDSSLSIFEFSRGPYCFIVSRQLKNFFGDAFEGYGDDDLKIFLEYLKTSMERGLDINPDAENYYDSTLKEFLSQLKARDDLLNSYGVKLQ